METPYGSAAASAAQFNDSRPRQSTETKALLSQCKELARARLGRIIADALDKVESDLFTLADGTPSRTEQQVLLEAMSQLKEHRAGIAGAFDQYFLEIFERRMNARKAAMTATQELSLESLSLVEDGDIEENLVISELARKTRNRIDPDQLLGIRARFGHLLAQELLEDDNNPLSPEAVFEALKLACAKIPGDFAVKRSLLNAFQPYVAAGIGTVYADLNQNLIAHQILPRIKHHVQRAPDNPVGGARLSDSQALNASQALGLSQLLGTSQGLAAGVGSSQMLSLSQLLGTSQALGAGGMAMSQPVPTGLGMSGPLDLSALLTGVLNGPPAARQQVARILADPGRYSLDNMIATPATPALMSSLSQLQASVAAGAHDGTADFLAALDQQVRTQSHPLDQLTIELVTMVFDYILDDKAVPETAKAEIARLQIVAVKAALLDRTFFARRQHPMRQLLDRIADAAQDPEVDTQPGSKFITGLHTITADVIAKFDDDLALFTNALEALEQVIAADTQARRSEIDSAAAQLAQQEQVDIAHASALAEIRRRLTRKTPGFVRDFLYNWWAKTLEDAYLHEREGDDSWTHRLGVVDALVWSVAPLKSGEIQQLASMLPTLMRSLVRGMASIEMTADTRQTFFNQLMQTHTTTINAAKALAKSGELPVQSAEELTAAAPDASQPIEPLLVEEVTQETADAAISTNDYYMHTVMAMDRGTVVEFVDGDTAVRSKLSWISPKQTILLFTSSGGGARQFEPKALAEALQRGAARVVEASDALMDRVVQAMVGDRVVPTLN